MSDQDALRKYLRQNDLPIKFRSLTQGSQTSLYNGPQGVDCQPTKDTSSIQAPKKRNNDLTQKYITI